MIWPWSKILKLETALMDEQRRSYLLERRALWLECEWKRTKFELNKVKGDLPTL